MQSRTQTPLSQTAKDEVPTVSVQAVLGGIRKHWAIVVAMVVLASGVGLLWSKSQPRIYQASSMLEFDPNPVRPIGNQGDPTTAWMFYLDSQDMYQTQFSIVTSGAVLTNVVSEMRLDTDPRFIGSAQKGSKLAIETATAALRAIVTVEPVKNSRLFFVRVELTDPLLATKLCHAVAHAYVDHNLDKGVTSSSDAALWLGGQVDHYNTELEASENALHEFKKDNELPSSSLEEVSKMIRLEMQTYDDAVTHSRTKRKELEARYAELAKVTLDDVEALPASELLTSGFVQTLRNQYLTARKDRQELLASGKGENHPLVKSADERIDGTKRALVDEVRNIQGAVGHDLEVIKRQEVGDTSLYEEARKHAVELNLKELEYHRLDRQRTENEKMYSSLLQHQKEADLARRMKVNNVDVIDEPIEPRAPIRPNTMLNIGIGALIGLIAGIGLAFLREQLDTSLKTPDDVERRLNLTFLGMLPSLDDDSTSYGGKKQRRVERGPRTGDPSLYVHEWPLSGVAEAARTLRTNLHFMSPDKPHRTILVTSSAPAEGKTTVACSVALAMAQAGHRVCIVDCDLRRPRLHRIFGRVGDAGVTSVLVGDASIGDVAKPATTGTDGEPIPQLWCIPAGSAPPNPADLLQSERFKKFLSELLEHFDRVVIDSPPLAAVTDSAIISTLVDTTLFVIRAFKTSHHLARQGLRALRDVDARVAGAVLNAVDLTKSSYSYYYQQYYYYRREGYGSKGVEDDELVENAPPPN